MLERLKEKWEEGGKRVELDEQSEKLVREMLWSEKGSPERQVAVDTYMEFTQENFDYTAKKRGWKESNEEEKLNKLEEIRKMYMEGDKLNSG